MPHLSGVEVSILVDGVALPEYKIITSGDHEVSCYVPSETGKKFQVSINDQGGDRGHRVHIHTSTLDIDGVKMTLGQVREEAEGTRFTIKGLENESRTAFQPFYFANLQVSEEGPELGGRSDALGTISLKVWWLRLHEVRPTLGTQNRNLPTLRNETVHEKSKKLTTHRVLLGESVLADQSHLQRSRSTIETRFPALTFSFHYANKDLLTARDIIPSTKPQVHTLPKSEPRRPKKRLRDTKVTDLEDGDDEMTKEEKEMLKQLQAKAARSKQSRAKRVKTEVKPEPGLGLTSYKVTAGGVIDLTDD